MSKHDYILARQQMRQFLKDTGVSHSMFYGPTSDEYWLASLRVLAVNMEPYGYEDCGFVEVDWPCLRDWMYDAGSTKTKTVRYTLAIMRTLIDTCANGTVPTGDYLRMAYSEAPELEAIAQRVVYYNIRPTSNANKEQNFASIVASGSSTIADFTRREMAALEPHIILVSGHAGLAAFNAMWQLSPALRFREGRHHSNGSFIQSIKHPSRPNYNEYASTIADIVRLIRPAV